MVYIPCITLGPYVVDLKRRQERGLNEYFSEHPNAIFSPKEFESWVREKKQDGTFPTSWPYKDIAVALVAGGWLEDVTLASDRYNSKTRLKTKRATVFQLGLSFRRGSYLSHGSAAYLNSIAPKEVSTIFVNKEQSLKKLTGELSQDGIDRAFARLPRLSNYRFWFMENKPSPVQFAILNGKNTNDLGVEWAEHPIEGRVRVTKVERTLIDLAVRPHYSAGLHSIVNAYSEAKSSVNVARLVEMLGTLDYLYPYHQSIGFFMTKAGFGKHERDALKEIGLRFRFYLSHGIENPQLDSEWNIYFPAGMS
jgi:hypothetical protein